MEYYLAIKKNEIMAFAGKWMELDVEQNNFVHFKAYYLSETVRNKSHLSQTRY